MPFVGIPFAVPPLGALRFRKPLPVPKNPLGYVDAGKHGKACMQPVEVLSLTMSLGAYHFDLTTSPFARARTCEAT